MFENIIDQNAVLQLKNDILSGQNAPSMLFYGPPNSGKGSSSLELARVLSCEQKAEWKCSCSSCEKHRYLLHDDILILGNRSFSAEITACKSAFLRNHTVSSVKLLFYRSLRKLQLRFSPFLLEDDPNLKKIMTALQSFDEKLNEFLAFNAENPDKGKLEKLCVSLENDALVLEKEGKLSSTIPIDRIRRASMWCNITPNGKHKTFIIENAQNMRNEAHNALLKLLEEPPSTVSIILTAQRREEIIPTILSRLRQYRFFKRDVKSEKEVIRLVFRDSINEDVLQSQNSRLTAYLESFAPQSTEKLYPLAAYLVVSMAGIINYSMKNKGKKEAYQYFKLLENNLTPAAGVLRTEPSLNSSAVIKAIISQSGGFEKDSFSGFLKICLEMICDTVRSSENPQFIVYNNLIKKHFNETAAAVEILKINVNIALEALFYNIKKAAEAG